MKKCKLIIVQNSRFGCNGTYIKHMMGLQRIQKQYIWKKEFKSENENAKDYAVRKIFLYHEANEKYWFSFD